jgi:23S rRNA pseudouridine1911/1915/1917 synthase
VAVVEGIVEQDEGVIRSYLAETSQFEVYSTDDEANGKLAITRYKKLKSGHGYTLMEFELDTGRKNQIRVHMQGIGHPIVGDKKYGSTVSPIGRLGLHARILAFIHPMSLENVSFETPVPRNFLNIFH